MHLQPPPLCTWDEAEDLLLVGAESDLQAGYTPLPTLAAFSGDEAVALCVLRPLDERGPVPALVEVLALLLPCEVDRLALLLPGRAWSLDDPIPPVCDAGDLRTPVVVVITADGTEHPCRPRSRVLRIDAGADGSAHLEACEVAEPWEMEAPVVDAVRILLDERGRLGPQAEQAELVAQLGRVVLLGHELALSPRLTDQLTLASAV